MKIIHPVAWVGLCINVFFVVVLIFSMSSLPAEEFTQLFGEIDQQEFISLMERILLPLVCFQGIALVLFSYSRLAGLSLALFSGFFMLPCSAVYMLGICLTHANVELILFKDAYGLPPVRGMAFSSSRVKNMRYAGYASFGVAALFVAVGVLEITLFGIASGGLLVWLARRAERHPPLVVHEHGLALMSTAMSKYVFLPYADMLSATLRANDTICFTMRLGRVEKNYVWPLAAIQAPQRQDAVELVAEALMANHVELI